jgi:hypothetical protein
MWFGVLVARLGFGGFGGCARLSGSRAALANNPKPKFRPDILSDMPE